MSTVAVPGRFLTSSSLMRAAGVGLLALGIAAAPVSAVSAGTCLDQVTQFAQAHKLNVDLPDVAEGGPAAGPGAGDLGKSGGVIEPPQVNDPAVIEPRGDVRYGMPTVPDLPSDAPPEITNGTSKQLGARDLAVLESMLVAARAEAQRGNEADCFKRLQMAKKFLGDKGQ